MKFIVAPDKFKGSLTGTAFCQAVEKALLEELPGSEVVCLPLADGGDGTLDIIASHLPGKRRTIEVWDPLMRDVHASYVLDKETNTAFIEMAEASGMRLLDEQDQNCYHTTSFGTGQLIADAMDQGATKIILGIGGSATNDCGIGMAQALGYSFQDVSGKELIPIGKNLVDIEYIVDSNVHPKILDTEFLVACDVTNPLYGVNGAAHIYAPQKGARPRQVEALDSGLQHISKLFQEHFGMDVSQVPGAGAAGGMGAGTLVFLGAELVSGVELVKLMIDFDKKIEGADWIITGEGKLDEQTLSGKTILGVLKSAKAKNIPVAAICGTVGMRAEESQEIGIDHLSAVLQRASNMEDAMENAEIHVRELARDFAHQLNKTGTNSL